MSFMRVALKAGVKKNTCKRKPCKTESVEYMFGSFLLNWSGFQLPFSRTVSLETVISCAVFFLLFESRQIPNFATKNIKKKLVNTLILRKELPKRLLFYKAYTMDEEDKYLRSD